MIKRLAASAIINLSHQLVQRCSVSGTSKGKGKIKAEQPLKRSKVTKKKGPDTSGGGGRKTGLVAELEEMAKKCLTALTPFRFLKPKQRAREAEP